MSAAGKVKVSCSGCTDYVGLITRTFSAWHTHSHTQEGFHILFFLFLHVNICCGYSFEAPW